MKLHSYLGGINVKPRRERTKTCEITSLIPKNEMIYPLIPYENKAPVPKVIVGERVKLGQQIAAASDGSLGVFSSVSGTVRAVEKRDYCDNKNYTSIIIDNDHQYEETEFDEVVALEQLNYEQIMNLTGAYGIREFSKTSIPLYEKLKTANGKNISCVIVNCVECEPYSTSIYRRLLEDAKMITDGLSILGHVFPKAKIVLAIGDDKMDAVVELEKRTKNEPNVEIAVIENKYPSADNCKLVYMLSGEMVKTEFEGISKGYICIQADTLCALYSAVFEGVPPMSRVITVAGSESTNPGNYEVLFGTKINEVIELTGGFINEPYKIVAGGVFTGDLIENTDYPVTSSIENILLLSAAEAPIFEAVSCIRCGRCVDACPNRLVPERLFEYAKRDKWDKFKKWNGNDCMLCGCCSYVCPSHIPLTGYFEKMKKQLEENER